MRVVLCLGWLLAVGMSAGAEAPAGETAQIDQLRQLVEQQQQVIEELRERLEAVEQRQAPPAEAEAEAAPPPPPPPSPDSPPLTATWNNRLILRSADSAFQFELGGRLHLDGTWFRPRTHLRLVDRYEQPPGIAREEDGFAVRRAWLYVRGRVYDDYSFAAEYDFTSSGLFRDLWIAANNVPYLGTLRVGHFREPFSLEDLMSSNFSTFMERALPNALAPGWNLGVLMDNVYLDDRMSLNLGLFRESTGTPISRTRGGYSFTGRVTGLPWYEEEGRRLLHLGMSYSYRNPDGQVRFQQRPETFLASRYVDTGDIPADRVTLFGAETGLIHGPFSVQGEYIRADVRASRRDNASFDGWYAYASYVLTGEHRRYRKRNPVFQSPTPRRNFGFGEEDGWGAWEVALRFSGIDLDDGRVRGGSMRDVTAGLNWYLNPNMRIMLNYVHGDVKHRLYSGRVQSLQTRFQVNF